MCQKGLYKGSASRAEWQEKNDFFDNPEAPPTLPEDCGRRPQPQGNINIISQL